MPEDLRPEDLIIKTLGEASLPSPLSERDSGEWMPGRFISDEDRTLGDIRASACEQSRMLTFEKAGPREKVFFDPKKTVAMIATCGGLCPGINDIVRGIVYSLRYLYGVDAIYGARYGYQGLARSADPAPVRLEPGDVEDIHKDGGTLLGSSRGSPEPAEMVDTLERHGVTAFFPVGGDGTMRGATAIAEEIERRGLKIAVVGLPKTIDNDIPLVRRSFGFDTAVQEACKALECAHSESKGAPNGVGLVKLMGRHAGFIAAHASIASGDVNYCLIPELEFSQRDLDAFINHLAARLKRRRHAVIAVAEGFGQGLLPAEGETDASGNARLADIGPFLKERVTESIKRLGMPISVKYIDPSYMIRSVPADSQDSIFCSDLARKAAHAAMAGKTSMLIGSWHGVFTHVPFKAIEGRRKSLDPLSGIWQSVLASTGQPARFE